MAAIDEAVLIGLHKGQPNGVAELDGAGKVPAAQLPTTATTVTADEITDATATGKALIRAADAASVRSTAGLGTAALSSASAFGITPRFIEDDLAVAIGVELSTHPPQIGGSWAKRSGYTGDMKGSAGSDAVIVTGAATSWYENGTAPGAVNVLARLRVKVTDLTPIADVSMAVVARAKSGIDTWVAFGLFYDLPTATFYAGFVRSVVGVIVSDGTALTLSLNDEVDFAIAAVGGRLAMLVNGVQFHVIDAAGVDGVGTVGIYGANANAGDEGVLEAKLFSAIDGRQESLAEQGVTANLRVAGLDGDLATIGTETDRPFGLNPEFLLDDLVVADGVNLTTHAPIEGGAWAKKSGYTGDLIGNVAGDAVILDGTGEALYENANVPTTSNVLARLRVKVKDITPTDSISVAIAVRSAAASDTHLGLYFGYYQPEDVWFWSAGQTITGADTDLAGDSITPSTDQVFDLALVAVGDRLAVLLDGIVLAAVPHGVAALGAVGIHASTSNAADEGAIELKLVSASDARQEALTDLSVPVSPLVAGLAPDLIQLQGKPPAPAFFTAINFGSYDFDSGERNGENLAASLVVISGQHAQGTGDKWRLQSIPLVGTWVGLSVNVGPMFDDDDIKWGVGLRESGTGKLWMSSLTRTSGVWHLKVDRYTDPDTFSSNDVDQTGGVDGTREWIVRFDTSANGGADVAVYAGPRGAGDLRKLAQIAKTTLFTTAPDQIVIGMVASADPAAFGAFGHYEN